MYNLKSQIFTFSEEMPQGKKYFNSIEYKPLQ